MLRTGNLHLLIFDGNCRVCIGLKNLLVKIHVVNEIDCLAYQDLMPAMKAKIDINNFRNGVALIQTDTEEVLYGSDSIAILFETAFPGLKAFFRIQFIFILFTFFYKLIAYNRYVIFLPKRPAIECDCYPDRANYYRGAYILLTWFLATALYALPGFELMCYFNTSYLQSGIIGSAFILSPFLIQMILFTIASKEQLYEYAGHLGSILLLGSILMLPAGLIGLATDSCSDTWVFVNLIVSLAVILRMHYKRGRFISLSKGWQVSFLILLIGSLFLSRYF